MQNHRGELSVCMGLGKVEDDHVRHEREHASVLRPHAPQIPDPGRLGHHDAHHFAAPRDRDPRIRFIAHLERTSQSLAQRLGHLELARANAERAHFVSADAAVHEELQVPRKVPQRCHAVDYRAPCSLFYASDLGNSDSDWLRAPRGTMALFGPA
jgi:hypothetical protein